MKGALSFIILPFLLLLSAICMAQENNDSISILRYAETNPIARPIAGKKFQAFIARDDEGNFISGENIREKIVFINFWFESCAPCVSEFGNLEALYQKYKQQKDFEFISFTFEDDSIILKTKQTYHLNFPICHISKDSCRLLTFNIEGYPSNYILNKKMQVEFANIGGPTDKNQIELLFKYEYEAHLNRLLQQ